MQELFYAFGIDGRMLVVQIVNFTILLGVLWYFLYRPLLAFLDKRKEDIVDSVQKAEAAEKLLRNADEERNKRIAEAAKEAGSIVDAAKSGAESKAGLIVSDAEDKARRLVEEGEAAAEEAKRRTLAESKEEITRMIVAGAEKTLREKVTTRANS